MRHVLDKSCRENENARFIFNNFFRKSYHLWDNVEKYSGDRGATNDVTIWRIRVACWISKAICTYAHAHVHASLTHMYARTDQHIILIAFPQQEWFRERFSVLRYTYIAPLVRSADNRHTERHCSPHRATCDMALPRGRTAGLCNYHLNLISQNGEVVLWTFFL
jgi:hypothetical protein